MFLALVLASIGSVEATAFLWLGALLVLCVAAFFMPGAPSFRWSPIGLATCGFAAWLTVTNAWTNPSYSAAAPYHASFLVGGFLMGRRTGEAGAPVVFGVGLTFAACLALWALAQKAGGAARGQALFETPAALAACINLVLLPGLAILALRPTHRLLPAVLVVLVGGIAAAASLGGWIALGAGLSVAAVGIGLARQRVQPRALVFIVGIVLVGILTAWAAQPMTNPASQSPVQVAERPQSAHERLDLYRLALEGMRSSPPWLGSGYLAFNYLVEGADPAVRDYTTTPIYFVHSDYLQTLLELGIPGLASLLLVVLLPFGRAWRGLTSGESSARPSIIALAAGLATMAVHAVGDFPFYLPICLLMFGITLGVLDSVVDGATSVPLQRSQSSGPLARAAAAGAVTLVAWVLIKPVAAEASARHAGDLWATMRAERAAYWFEVARRVEPRDWRYHWYAGQFWYAQARAGAGTGAAQRADAAFADGFKANPREVRNLLGRMATQVHLHGLLPAAVDDSALREWRQQALALAPHDPAVRAELAALDAPIRGGTK